MLDGLRAALTRGDLFATRDGGLTWQKQTPPVPNGTIDPFGHASPPRFADSQHGAFLVTFRGLKVDGYGSVVAIYRTSDSGKRGFGRIWRKFHP
jgi:hypothetical protein